MSRSSKLLSCALALAALCAPLSRNAYAAPDAPFALVKDIQTTPQPMGSMYSGSLLVPLGDTILFAAHTPQTGVELWRTNGTEAGTSLVKDIQPGEGGSIDYYDVSSVVLNGAFVFAAADGATGTELWRSDGTSAGTTLLQDTWPGGEGGQPVDFHVVGNRAFFTAQISETQRALWITDGTAAGTTLLMTYRSIGSFIVLSGTLLFSAAESGSNSELWRSDGTPAGTRMVKDINPGPEGSDPGNLVVARPNELVLFRAYNDAFGTELWRTDGTPAGTQVVADLYPSQNSSRPTSMVPITVNFGLPNLGYFTLFAADDGASGQELWVTDGYFLPEMLMDVYPGRAGSDPYFLAMKDCVTQTPNQYVERSCPFFNMTDPTHGRELWITDGTYNGTILLKDIYTGTTGSNIGTMVKAGNAFFFSAANEPTGHELWRTNGTPAGTVQVADIYSGTQSSSVTDLTAFNDRLYFIAEDGVHGRELWRSDGTRAGTTLLKDIGAGKVGGANQVLGAALGALYFIADDGATGYELWKTDGTPGGTVLVKNIAPDVGGTYVYPDYNLAALGDRLVMGVGPGGYDLAAASLRTQTSAVTNIETGMEASADDGGVLQGGPTVRPSDDMDSSFPRTWGPRSISALDSRPHSGIKDLRGNDGTHPDFSRQESLQVSSNRTAASTSSLWVSDGTDAGTTAIRSFPSVEGEGLNWLTTLGNGVLFGGTDSKGVHELWRTDGTSAGTSILGNAIKPYFGYVERLTKLNDLVVFSVMTDTTPSFNTRNYSVWKTDGTAQGTQLVKANVRYGNYDYAASGNTIFFAGAVANTNNYELWKTDGTEAGTVQVKDIYSGTNGSYPGEITPGAPGHVFFIADVGASGDQLWKSDGTEQGTTLVYDVRPSTNYYEYDDLVYVNGTLFFAANDGVNGWEVWRSDGTPGGTALLADIYPGYGSSWPDDLIGLNGVLYFSATGPDGRRTLWRSDGTPAGTQPVRADVDAPMNPYELTVVGGRLMFSAADETHGREAWQSNGTSAGTMLIQDVMAGADSSNPQAIIETTKHIYFTADTPGIGRELWARPLGDGPTPTPAPGGYKTHLPMVTR